MKKDSIHVFRNLQKPDHADAYVFRFVFFTFFFHLWPTLGRYKQAARISTLFNDVSGTSHKALHARYAGQHCKSLCAYPSDKIGGEREGERKKKWTLIFVPPQSQTARPKMMRNMGKRNALRYVLG